MLSNVELYPITNYNQLFSSIGSPNSARALDPELEGVAGPSHGVQAPSAGVPQVSGTDGVPNQLFAANVASKPTTSGLC